MTKDQDQTNKDEFDIFIANTIYPDAKGIFKAHTEPIEVLKDNCIIALDTNVLLLPYNTGRESLKRIGEIYKKLVETKQLIVPGQVAREFAKNRANKLAELFQQINRKSDAPNLQKGHYPLLESLDIYQEVI